MLMFLLTFLFLYGGIHFYAFMRVKSLFPFSWNIQIVVIVLLIILIFAPLLTRLLESRHLDVLARITAYTGYLWMAFIFLFFFLSVSFDILRLVYKFLPFATTSVPLGKIALCLAVFLSLVLVVYGFIDAYRVRVVNLEVQAGQMLPGNGKIRIVQISDVHVGLIVRERKIKLVLDKVKEANPDILVSTGDLLDGELDNVMPLADLFTEIKPRFGKYAITGNHEFYAGIEESLKFTRRAGFEVLRDEVKKVAGINIIGVDDITGRRFGIVREDPRAPKPLPPIANDGFVLVLKHQPVVNGNERFNLQLSGHTHGGQLIPFRLITHLFFPRDYGFYSLDNNRSLYVSRGTGTWGPPVRVFAPPEITVIDLIGKKSH
jgi:uncharacterized protein